ncbi:hypothetical protein DF18_20975 [Streptomyces rimosus]|nr:hypothetical protein DF18_20975 [Streptomyces rimosus]
MIVESMLRTSFCAVPAFRRVDPVRSSGPTTTSMPWSAAAASAEPALQDRPMVSAPRAARACSTAPIAYGVRHRGGDADDRVVAGQAERVQVGGGQVRAVLGALDGGDHGGGAARDQAHDLGRVGVEGGRALARVQHAEAPGRAGARVDQPPAAGHPLGGGVDGGGDRGELVGDGGGDGGVLAVHRAGDLQGGQPVDLGQVGPEGFGGQRVQLRAQPGVLGGGGHGGGGSFRARTALYGGTETGTGEAAGRTRGQRAGERGECRWASAS